MIQTELDVLRDEFGVKTLLSEFCKSMNDTDPQIDEVVRRRLLERSGAERVLMGSRMFDAAKAMVVASFPDGLTDIEIKARLCERLYGNEIDVSAFLKHLRSLQPTRNTSRDLPLQPMVNSHERHLA